MKERKRNYKVSEESAEVVLDEFLDYYEIYLEDFKDQDERNNVEGAINAVLIHIRMGYIEIEKTKENDINIKQNRKNGASEDSCFIYESTRIAKAKVQMKTAKNDDQFGKMYALMGSLSGNGSQAIMNLKGIDYRVMESLSVLFLQCTSG